MLKHLGVGKTRVLEGVEVNEVTLLQISALHISTNNDSVEEASHIRAPWKRRVLPANA